MCLSVSVANLASNGKGLFIESDGAARLAQIRIAVAKVAEVIAFTAFVANLLGNGESLFLKFNCAASFA